MAESIERPQTAVQWYWALGEERQGPVTMQQLKTLATARTIQADTLT